MLDTPSSASSKVRDAREMEQSRRSFAEQLGHVHCQFALDGIDLSIDRTSE